MAAKESPGGNIGVIGTAGTVGSHIYREYIQSLRPEAQVFEKACPLFCPSGRGRMAQRPGDGDCGQTLSGGNDERREDTLILGCTHYPLLRSTVRKIMGEDVVLVNPAYETAIELRELLRAGKDR